MVLPAHARVGRDYRAQDNANETAKTWRQRELELCKVGGVKQQLHRALIFQSYEANITAAPFIPAAQLLGKSGETGSREVFPTSSEAFTLSDF